ncbi:DUF2634 domain-containing protein [Priestia megaterium]|uniref:DUF2634 domain-containing protein n=1 Tax=Priestia megaterium TaxID=1404 RepID=UPI001D6EBE7D|nr:DUF2634 domain-containing protein [Priestia megaterium]CAH0305246.1 hypothetical protein SRABI82_04703 [Priestia megaterium]
MPLVPDFSEEELAELLAEAEADEEVQPSKTYKIDFENGRLGGFIDETEALQQAVQKALITARERFLIYTDEYGCEIEDLIGSSVTNAFIETEIPRVIEEALVYDDRIDSVNDLIVNASGDTVTISFSIMDVNGEEITFEELEV